MRRTDESYGSRNNERWMRRNPRSCAFFYLKEKIFYGMTRTSYNM
jgi:hypothetical protein